MSLDPTVGHEQRGPRPVLVISEENYNARSGMVLICPITSHIKEYPFEVLCKSAKTKGVILVDQIRAIDWSMRSMRFVESVSGATFREVQMKIKVLVE